MPSKREALARFHRKTILAAAKELFATQGVGETTMGDIARHADYSKSTLYTYFGSKEELCHHIALENMELLKSEIGECLTGGEPEENYLAICHALVRFRLRQPISIADTLDAASADPEELARMPVLLELYRMRQELNNLACDILRRGMENGLFRPDLDPLPTVIALFGAMGGIVHISGQNEAYLHRVLGSRREEFLDLGFRLLLQSILAVPSEASRFAGSGIGSSR